MEATTPPVNYPEWTEYKEKNGLDPLGMQNASVNLDQTFLPGISNVTLRMRYYGLSNRFEVCPHFRVEG